MQTTGWPPGMLQDDSRELSRWLSTRLGARYQIQRNNMSTPTWGLRIPGYSSPSPAQERLFKQRYPDVVAWHNMDKERQEREARNEEQRVRAKYAKKGT